MLGFSFNPQKRFAELGEREILALAITLEEEDGRIYRDFAEGLRADLPRLGQGVRRHGRGGKRPSPDADRPLPRALRRTHPAGPARGRPRLRAPQADLADAAAWASTRCGGGPRSWSRRPRTSTARPPSRSPTPASASCWSTWPRSRRTMPARRISSRSGTSPRSVRESEEKIAHRAVRAAVRPAGPRRADGRLGLDAGAAVRRGVRHRPQLGRVPGRPRGLDRRRHLDGLRRGAVRRRQHHRPRPPLDARPRLRR